MRGAAPNLDLNQEHLSINQKMSQQITKTDLQNRTLNEFNGLVDSYRTTGNGWFINVKTFNSGDIETVAIQLGTEDSLKRGGGGTRKSKDKDDMVGAVLKKSQSRAKKKVRHAAYQIGVDRMITLTYRENMMDIDRAWRDFKLFNQAMKRKFPNRWSYVVTPEFQKRGAIHFHLAVSGFYHANTVRRIWQKVVGEGNIDITSPKKYGFNSWNPKRIARYIGKYMTKNETVEFNRRRYSTSKIEPPQTLTGWLALGVPVMGILNKLIYSISRNNNTESWEYDGYFHVVGVST